MANADPKIHHNLNGSSEPLSNRSKTGSQLNHTNNYQTKLKPKVVIDWECVNSECSVIGSNVKQLENHETPQVKTASKYVVSFYGQGLRNDNQTLKTNKIAKKRKVCLPCERKALDAQDKMLVNLAADKSVIIDKLFPTSKDVVLIEDSDEEPITDTSSDSEVEMEFEKEGIEEFNSDQDIEMKLEREINAVLGKFNIEQQAKDSLNILNNRLDHLQSDYEETDEALKNIEKEVDRIRATFYQPFRPVPKFLEPLDLNLAENVRLQEFSPNNQTSLNIRQSAVKEIVQHTSTASLSTLQTIASLPPPGKLERPELTIGEKVYGIKGNILNVWKVANVVEITPGTERKYKLRFESLKDGNVSSYFKTVSAKHSAYTYPASVRLLVGTRIIAVYNDHQHDDRHQSSPQGGEFYSGIIAEPPKAMNKHRYLVFFDDGYASYVKHQDIRVVCQQTEINGNISGVWDDIHPNSKEFIKKYLIQYPERPMVRLMQNQTVRTEWEGSWWYTKVEAVDASLVKLIFHVNGRKESVYRGSTRLEPLYLEMQQQKKRAEQMILNQQAAAEAQGGKTQNINRFMPRNRIEGYKKNRPYVEYTRQPEQDSPSNEDQPVRRAVAKKSTGSKRSPPQTTESFTDKPSWDKRVSRIIYISSKDFRKINMTSRDPD